MRCRVVTWNVHSCVGRDGRHDPERVADVLAPLEADVVGLQEVDWRLPRLDGSSQLEVIAARLGMTAIEGKNLRDHRGAFGNALLTRLEVEGRHRVALSTAGREPRGAIDAHLRVAGARLRVLVTHLGLRRAERLLQARRLRAAVLGGGDVAPPWRAAEPPTLLLGDLNEWRPRAIARRLLVPDPFPEAAWARTYPSRLPVFGLDQILVRPVARRLAFGVVTAREARAASDHLPLVADLEWDPPR